jgi:hypothetical protein
VTSVRFKVQFGRQRESRLTAQPSPPSALVAASDASVVAAPTTTAIARLLALAHLVERLVEAGELKDYAHAARQLGMAKSHMTHVTNLLSLAPDIQEAILNGQLVIAEQRLRGSCRLTAWGDQRAGVRAAR